MKYIRAKNKIFQVLDIEYYGADEDNYCYVVDRIEDGTLIVIYNEDVVKQANTIPELCDGIIVEEKDNENNWFVMSVEEFKREEEHLANWTYNAFIKTNKGIIYVAKMEGILPNGEIDWELLWKD